MPQLNHDDVMNPANRWVAKELATTINDYTDGRDRHAALMALAQVFVGICDTLDVDASATFEQVLDAPTLHY